MQTRNRKYIISWNNYPTTLSLEKLRDNILELAEVEYLVLGFERGEEKHTPHIQGYVRFRNAISFESLRKILKNDDETYGYIEIAKGNDNQNRDYCTKENNYIEYGEINKNEKSDNLEPIFDDIMNNMDFLSLCKKYSNYVLYHYKDFSKLYNDINLYKEILKNKKKYENFNNNQENKLKELEITTQNTNNTNNNNI